MREHNDKTNLRDELAVSLTEGIAILRGEVEPTRFHSTPAAVDVCAVRKKLGLTQEGFAQQFWFGLAIVTEGYATGRAVHRAADMAVAVALDTSNLMAVATALRDQDPERPIYMGADNDYHLPLRAKPLLNAGREKAEAAAKAVGGVVLLPDPVADQVAKGKGTDWQDFEASQGRAATRAALRAAGLQELTAQDERVAAKPCIAERQGSGLSA